MNCSNGKGCSDGSCICPGGTTDCNGQCLPAGPLREPVERLLGVDLIVCQGERPQPGEFGMVLLGDQAVNLRDESIRRPLTDWLGTRFKAIAAIGHPERFFGDLRRLGLRFEQKAFADHHAYAREDIGWGEEVPVLMTEKDAVKCRALAGRQHWYVPVDAILPATFGEALLTLLKTKCDGQKTA
jgi:tetraacyldisaccharide 4'-kinase